MFAFNRLTCNLQKVMQCHCAVDNIVTIYGKNKIRKCTLGGVAPSFQLNDVHVPFQSCHWISSDCLCNLMCRKCQKSNFGVLLGWEACPVRGPAPRILRPALSLGTPGPQERPRTSRIWLPAPFLLFGPCPYFGHPSHTHTLSPEEQEIARSPHACGSGWAGSAVLVCCPKDLQNQLSSPNTFPYLLTPCLSSNYFLCLEPPPHSFGSANPSFAILC